MIFLKLYSLKLFFFSALFFDWDDTLLPSTALITLNVLTSELTDPVWKTAFGTFTNIVIQLLETALSRGKVFIVTNGQTGWVEKSAQVSFFILFQ
jgi:hypothetical protein